MTKQKIASTGPAEPHHRQAQKGLTRSAIRDFAWDMLLESNKHVGLLSPLVAWVENNAWLDETFHFQKTTITLEEDDNPHHMSAFDFGLHFGSEDKATILRYLGLVGWVAQDKGAASRVVEWYEGTLVTIRIPFKGGAYGDMISPEEIQGGAKMQPKATAKK